LLAIQGGIMSRTDALSLLDPKQLLELSEPRMLVDPFIPAGGLVVLFGPSGTYKTFVALDWAAQAPGLAVYLSGEGSPRRFGDRIKAWEDAAGRHADMLVHPYAIDLLQDADMLTNTLRSIGDTITMVVVDTVARNTAGL